MKYERVTKVVDRKDAAKAVKNKRPEEIIIVDMQKEHISIDMSKYLNK